MYVIEESAVITGDLAAIWATEIDLDHRAAWDPHEESMRLEGEFVVGGRIYSKPQGAPGGWSTISAVDPGSSWESGTGLPFGKLCGGTYFDDLGDGRIEVTKRMQIHGPFWPVFRLIWERGVRHDMLATFAALEAEAARRDAIHD
jgi:hypothetical protein